jgi:hypothetical protein
LGWDSPLQGCEGLLRRPAGAARNLMQSAKRSSHVLMVDNIRRASTRQGACRRVESPARTATGRLTTHDGPRRWEPWPDLLRPSEIRWPKTSRMPRRTTTVPPNRRVEDFGSDRRSRRTPSYPATHSPKNPSRGPSHFSTSASRLAPDSRAIRSSRNTFTRWRTPTVIAVMARANAA